MLRRYELMIILDSSQSDDDISKQIEKIKEMITSAEGGEILVEDIWGKKRLAYEIKGKQFGYYVVLEFMAPTSVPKVIDHYARIEPTVVRHMIIHIEPKILKMKEREQELKTSLDLRRKKMAEQNDDSDVVDMLKLAGEGGEQEAPAEASVEEAPAEEAPKEEAPAEATEEVVEEKKEEKE
jgi:small subunit ribosomal protein S6